jgi:hypothetical protein
MHRIGLSATGRGALAQGRAARPRVCWWNQGFDNPILGSLIRRCRSG